MKKIILLTTLVLGVFCFQSANAQVRVKLGININTQPVWGPVGYDHVEYYYIPDIDVFYYVPGRQYVYFSGGRWVFSTYLPVRYRDFDFNTGYKVVVNEPRPYRNAERYRTQYAGYKGRHDQEIIRNSHDQRYWGNKNHPEHKNWNNGRGPRRGHE
jgi:hypothetical protein